MATATRSATRRGQTTNGNKDTNRLNGWDVDAMTEAIEGVQEQPDTGRVTWRATVNWDGGFGLDVHTRSIEQAGHQLQRHFTLRGDHPPELLGENTGPTAIETVIAALGACMAGTYAAQATARGVKLDALELDVSANIDLNGFFGLKEIPSGLSNVHLDYRVQADASDEQLQEIMQAAKSLSPIFDTVTRPVNVEVALERG